MTGTYAVAGYNTTTPISATQQMMANLSKYTPFKLGIPSLNIVQGYASADLMIKGLEMAGSTPPAKRSSPTCARWAPTTPGGSSRAR